MILSNPIFQKKNVMELSLLKTKNKKTGASEVKSHVGIG
jgi:hypothetical protein